MYKVFTSIVLLGITTFSHADLNCQDPSYMRDLTIAKYCQSINNATQNAQQQYESNFFNEQLKRLNQFGPNFNPNTNSPTNNTNTNSSSQTNTNNTNQTQQNSSSSNNNNNQQNSGSSVNYY